MSVLKSHADRLRAARLADLVAEPGRHDDLVFAEAGVELDLTKQRLDPAALGALVCACTNDPTSLGEQDSEGQGSGTDAAATDDDPSASGPMGAWSLPAALLSLLILQPALDGGSSKSSPVSS